MQQEAEQHDQEERGEGAEARRQQQAAAGGADGDDDEHDLDALEHDDLERGRDPDPVPAARRPPVAAQRLRLAGEGGRLVVERDHAGRAQDRLPEPAQAEEEDQRPDRELHEPERDAGQRRPEC